MSYEPVEFTELKDMYTVLREQIISLRRFFHQNPEVGWYELGTTEKLMEVLQSAGLEVRGFERTGVIAEIIVNSESNEFKALRADIDALPLKEKTGLEYASRNEGVSHSCGHDFHIASVLGAALTLQKLKPKLKHNLRFIFQPAEETRPSGATEIIKQGAVKGVTEIYAMHAEPRLEVGKIGIRQGPITSAADTIIIRLKGKGGHSSRPHLTADVVQALGAIALNTSAILSRRFDPRSVVSLTWGSVHAGSAANAIPNSGEMKGIIRMTDIDAWQSAEQVLREVIAEIVKPYGAQIEIDYEKGVPPVVNDEEATEKMEHSILSLFGEETLHYAERSLGGEDFAWYLLEKAQNGSKISGAMARMGAATPGLPKSDIHQPDMIADEKLLDYAVPFLASLVI